MAALVLQVAITAAASYFLGKMAAADAEEAQLRATIGREVSPAPPAVNPLKVEPQPGGALPGLFGYRRVGGPVILSGKSGTKSYLVIMLAGAPVAGFAGVYMNNALVTLDGSGNVTSKPWTDVLNVPGVNVKLYDGTQTAADAELVAAFPGWTATDHIGTGIAYARVIMDPEASSAYFADILNTVPDFTFGVLGFKCYDPRNGAHVLGTPSTYSWSNNVSICRANYFIHELGMRRPASAVDWASVATAANVDDELVALDGGGTERRYTCAAYWMTDQRHEDVLSKFDAANGGTFGPIGDKWRSSSGSLPAATAAITPDDYEADGLTFSDYTPISSAANGVRGTFSSPLHYFETRDFPAYQDATALSIDAAALGISTAAAATWLDRNFEFVTSASQAQRLARIDYNKARYGHAAALALQFTHFDTVSGDAVTVTDDLAGFAAKTFRVTSDALDPDWIVRLDLEHETAAFYAWTAATDEAPFIADDPLLGEPGGLKPPGFALVDTNATATIVPNMVLWPSPSTGWDVFVVSRNGSADVTFPKGTAITNFAVAVNAGSGLIWSLKVRNTATGEESPSATAISTTGGAVSAQVEATTPLLRMPAAPAPRLRSAHSGLAQLDILAVSSSRCDQIVLYSSATNDTGTATVLSTLSNTAQISVVTGAAGTVRFYWTVAKNTGTGETGPFSNAAVVVF